MADGNGAGGNQVFQVLPGDHLTIDSFGTFGNTALPLEPEELDTLRFSGAGLVAANLQLRQIGNDVLVTFIGAPDTSITLTNITVERLENITGAGNFQFDGEAGVTDGIDIWSAAQQDLSVATPDRTTFLNNLGNQVDGLDGGNDVINGQGGSDVLNGLSGNDVLRGGDGNDTLDGGTGNDRLEGGTGNDIYIVDSASDQVIETVSNGQNGGWSDEVRSSVSFSLYNHVNIEGLRLTGTADINGVGNSGNNFLFGNDGNNSLRGREGNDRLVGGAGNDNLEGGSGGDTLTGGTGNDVINGGDGQDVAVFAGKFADYTFSPAGATYYVQDMNPGDGDTGNDFVTNVEILRFEDRDIGTLRAVTDGDLSQNLVMEGSPNGSPVGITATASHTTGGDVVYSLTDSAGGRFAIDPATGAITVANGAAIDYETSHEHSVTVRATDPLTGLYREQSFEIAVGDEIDEDVSIVDLGTIGSNEALHIIGAAVGDHAGYSLSTAGDINGDGLDDVIVGVLKGGNGEAYVVFGKAGGGMIDLADLAPEEGYRISGIGIGDQTAHSVSHIGDINGDGFDDIIIGAPFSDVSGYNAGQAHVIYGGQTGDIDLETLDPARGFTLNGPGDYDIAGISVSGAGDINGDGIDDFVVAGVDGTQGRAFVVYGAEGGLGNIDLGALTPDQGFRVIGTDDYTSSGFRVAAAGDFNGDGLDDIIIGGYSARPENRHYAGESYIIFGQHGDSSDIDLGTLNASQGIRIAGASEYDFSGFALSGAGDINGDGFSDVFIGAPATDESRTAYLIYGRNQNIANLDLGTIGNYDGIRIVDSANDLEARSIAIAGDINGDGLDDMIVNAAAADPEGRWDAGASFVVYGRTDLPDEIDLATLTTAEGFKIIGAESRDMAGMAVSGAGDVNGDGFDDIAIGVFQSDPLGRAYAGETYIIYGGDFTNAVTMPGGPEDNVISSTEMNAVLIGGGGNDDITGTGQVVIYGGSGNDRMTIDDFNGFPTRVDGGTGIDTLAVDDFGGAVDLTVAGLRGHLASIEIVDLSGSRSNMLTLDSSVVAGLAGNNGNAFGANTLLIKGDDTDLVNFIDQGWSMTGTIADPYGQAGDFAIWRNGSVTALVDVDASVSANNIDLARLTTEDGITISGIAAFDGAGRSVSNLGDINGDNIDDIAVGAPGTDLTGRTSAGVTYVIYGRDDGSLADIDLGDFTAADGFRLIGAAAGHNLGGAIGSAGDVNGDGIDDIIVGAPGADTNTGITYVIYGTGADHADLDLATLDTAQGFSIAGIDPADFSGLAVNSAGDINGDGFDDLVIGAQGRDLPGRYQAGEAYVIFGGDGLTNVDLATMTAAQGFRLSGSTDYDGIGRSVSSAGDINGDGIDDFMVAGVRGTHAKAFIVYGHEGAFTDIDLQNFTPEQGFTITGTSDFDSGGFAVSHAGDVNGDGFEDIILGDSSARQIGRHYSGETYVIYGNDTGHADIDLTNLLPSQGFRLNGAYEYDFSGRSVSAAGDINGDGFGDILIGAGDVDVAGRTDAGTAYVIFGSASPHDIDLRLIAVDEGFKIAGAGNSFFAGVDVSAAGDLNGDGYDDLLVGSSGADVNGEANAGEAYVIYGRDFGSATLTAGDIFQDAPGAERHAVPAATLYPGSAGVPIPDLDASVT